MTALQTLQTGAECGTASKLMNKKQDNGLQTTKASVSLGLRLRYMPDRWLGTINGFTATDLPLARHL